MALAFVLIEDWAAQGLGLLGAELLATALGLLLLDLHQHARGLFGAHHRDARVRPHPQEARVVGAAAHAVVTGAKTAANDHRELGHPGTGHRGHQLGAVLGDAAFLVLLADHKAGDVLQEQQRNAALAGQFDKVRALLRGLGKQDAVIGQNRHRIAVQVRKPAHQRGAEQRLELIERAVVDQPRNHLAHVERLLAVSRNHPVQLLHRIARRQHRAAVQLALLVPVQIGDAAAGQSQGVFVILGVMVGHARGAAVHIRAAQRLGADHFAGRGLHQRRPGEEDSRLFAHHDGLVGHRRHVSAAGSARAHHHGDLRNARRAHIGLIEEDPPEVLPIREHLVLAWQVSAAGVDQIDAGQAVLTGDGLRPQVLLHAQRIVGTTLHRGVIGDDHALNAFDPADTGDHPGRRHRLAIDLMGGQLTDLQKGRTRIEQGVHALTRQQLATRQMSRIGRLATACGNACQQALQVADQGAHGGGVGYVIRGAGGDLGL